MNDQPLTPPILAREYQYQYQRIARHLHLNQENMILQYRTEYDVITDQVIFEIDKQKITFDEPDLHERLDFVSEKYIQPILWRKLIPLASYNVLVYLSY